MELVVVTTSRVVNVGALLGIVHAGAARSMTLEPLLKDLGLEDVAELLQDNDIDDVEALKSCSDADLIETGMKLGPRRVIAAWRDRDEVPGATALETFLASISQQKVHVKLVAEGVDTVE